jgi:hypothetical protein
MNRVVKIFVVLLFVALNLQGAKRDTAYIEDYSDIFILRFQSTLRTTELDLTNNIYNKTLKLKPNDSRSIGFSFSYKWLGIGIGFTPAYMNRDNAVYGKTSRFDVQINTYARKYLFNFYLQWYKGFYVSNPKDIVKGWESVRYPTIPGAQTANFGANFYWIFNNKKFSYRSVYLYNEIQKHSASSFIFGGGFNMSSGYSDNYFLPEEWLPVVNADTIPVIKKYGAMGMYFSGGYAFTLASKGGKFYFNLSFVLNLGPYISSSTLLKENDKKLTGNFALGGGTDGRLSLGTNIGKKNRMFIGLTAVTMQYFYKLNKEYSIKSIVRNAKLFIGYRFL